MTRAVVVAVLTILSAGSAIAAEPAGTFELSSGLGPNLCLRASGPLKNDTPLVVGACDGSPATRFHVEGNTLRLGGLCVDDARGQGKDLDEIIAYGCHGRENQQWSFAPDGTIRGIHGKCIDVKGGMAQPGSPAILFTCHGRTNQQWKQKPVGGRVTSRLAANLCLNVLGGLKAGATVGTWSCEDGANSQFHMEDGRIVVGDLCLAAGDKNGVIAVPCNDARVRSFTATADGLLKSDDGKCLDVDGANPARGTRALLWPCHGKVNQQWNFPGAVVAVTVQPTPPVVAPPPPAAPTPVPVAPVNQRTAISDDDFGGIVEAINNASFSEDKVNTLRTAAEGRSFTVAQVGSLVDLFPFSDGKITVVQTLHQAIVDPQNKYKLLEHFTFSTDKEKVSKLLK